MMSVAVMRCRRSQLEEIFSSKPPKLKALIRILDSADQHLLHLQIGKLLNGMALGACLFEFFRHPDPWMYFSEFGGFTGAFGSVLYLLIITLVVVGAVIVFIQSGKALGYYCPEKVLHFSVFFLRALSLSLGIFARALSALIGFVLQKAHIPLPDERLVAITPEEITEIVEESSEAGALEEEARDIITGVFELSETSVREVMTPRSDVVVARTNDSLETIRDIFQEEGFSRLLVIGEDLDEVKGILLAKDLLPFLESTNTEFHLSELLRTPAFVAEDERLADVLRKLQQSANHFAVVLDEHGGVCGIVTMEDLLEEIFGEIFDETDSPEDEDEVYKTKTGDFIIDGGASVADLNHEYGFSFPEGEYDTLAGFVIHELGRIPESGEELAVNGLRLLVEQVENNRVVRLKISKSSAASSEES